MTAEGVKALAVDRIQEVTFKHPHKPTAASEEVRNLLTLKLDWGRTTPTTVVWEIGYQRV